MENLEPHDIKTPRSSDEQQPATLSELLSLSRTRTAVDYRLLARLSEEEVARNKDWNDADRAEIDALLAEYSSLRQESMNSTNNRIQVMVLGLASIAAISGGALAIPSLRNNSSLITAVFSWAIPLICVYILLIWLSEAIRAHRVGYFIASSSEAKINQKLGRLVLSWEAGLWTGLMPRDELFGPSMIALAILGIVAVLSPWLGRSLNGTHVAGIGGSLLWTLVLPYALFAGVAVYSWKLLPRLRNKATIQSDLAPGDAGGHADDE